MNALESARQEINDIDRQMAELFEKRMYCCDVIGKYKKENGIPVKDEKREAEIILKNCSYIRNKSIEEYYSRFLKNVIELSCRYQSEMPESEDI